MLNADNEITAGFAGEAMGEITWFGLRNRPGRGFFLDGEDLVQITGNGERREIMRRGKIRLPGLHNVENYLAAFAATEGLVFPEVWRKVASAFPGVEHRIEFVRQLDGVSYYNDSIASSPTRTTAGLRSFDGRVVLIAGGYDKKIPFDDLGAEIVRGVKALALVGDTAGKIRESVEKAPGYRPGAPKILLCADMEEAVSAARRASSPGDVVLLSPACASFDRYRNFAERGQIFKQIVNKLE